MSTARLFRILPGLAFLGVSLALLEHLVQTGVLRRALLPPPSVIWATLWDLLASGTVLTPMLATLTLFVVGFVLATLLGVGLGLAMGSSRFVSDLLEPLVEVIRPIPKAALVPVLMLFLGLGFEMKVTSTVLASFFPILINTIQGVRGVDPVLIDTGRTFGRSRTAIAFGIVLPAAVPYIVTGMRVGLGLALLMTVLSEMLAGSGGLGALILENQRAFRIRQMYAWLVILAAFGYAINLAMTSAERRLVPWLEKFRE